MLPNNEHRFCLKHLYNNFKIKFRGKLLRDLFWNAASCGDMFSFEAVMKEVHKVDAEAAKWFMVVGPKFWVRSHFSNHYKCDVVVDNMNESARDKGIINMLEWIRKKLMVRFQVKREGMNKYVGSLGPRI